MDRFRAASRRSSSTSATSSPALPELSIDASLQRLHLQEENSASSISSAPLSRDWLHDHQESEAKCNQSVPDHLSPSHAHAATVARSFSFRFPPLEPNRRLATQPATSILDDEAARSQGQGTPARPRTSRGLTHPKPFLSSSRATSIESIAEVDDKSLQSQLNTRMRFGTPFANDTFTWRPQTASSSPRQTLSALVDNLTQSRSFMSPKQQDVPMQTSYHQVQTACLRAPLISDSQVASSSWTLLFAPIESTQSSSVIGSQFPPESSIILPLLSSFDAQIEQLRSDLAQNQRNSGKDTAFQLFLDLSSFSALPSCTLARLTPQSWPILFHRFRHNDAAIEHQALPYWFRETGLPIVALVRYCSIPTTVNIDPSDVFLSQAHAPAKPCESQTREVAKPANTTHDCNPWTRAKARVTPMLPTCNRLSPLPRMTASRSYPGVTRESLRKSPMSYSPNRNAFHSASVRHRDQMPQNIHASPMKYSHSQNLDASKLRSLSLAATHPLAPSENAELPMAEFTQDPNEPRKPSTSLYQEQTADDECSDTYSSDLESTRRYQEVLQGFSHKSHRSTSTVSTRSTRPTSVHSSRAHFNGSSEQQQTDNDDDDSDLGTRFWTQFSNLGQQVLRENTQVQDTRRRGGRSVSLSSTASATSVFDFSPLGILVPTDGVVDADAQQIDKEVTTPLESHRVASISDSSAGNARDKSLFKRRRRAYSSMVPLTGWRAGDSDLRFVEAQQSVTFGQLPQVLLAEAREGVDHGAHAFDHGDVITPTVASFQGRARALSVQPPPRRAISGMAAFSTMPQSTETDVQKQQIWNETMLHLSERMNAEREQRPVTYTSSLGAGASWDSNALSVESRDAMVSEARSSMMSTRVPKPVIADDGSSSLPGLFYDDWVQQVDGAVDGELGRRGSAIESPDTRDRSRSDAEDGMAGLGTHPPTSMLSSSSTTTVGSVDNECRLQIPLEPDCPLPQPRSEILGRDTDSLPVSSASLLSMETSVISDEAVQESSNCGSSPGATGNQGFNVSPSDEDVSHKAPAALEHVWLTRSQSVGAAYSCDLPSDGTVQPPASASLSPATNPISEWADLAQRLESPGSMRLLCLAASRWSPDEPDGSRQHAPHSAVSDSTILASGLTIPSSSTSDSLVRSRSFGGGRTALDLVSEGARGTAGLTVKLVSQPKIVFRQLQTNRERAKTVFLGPIRSDHSHEASANAVKLVSARAKRSLSNIFDMPSPITPHQRLE